jgi:hypothetical protein
MAERTRRDRLKFNKQTREADIMDELLADPKKLFSILAKIRAKLAPALQTPPGTEMPAETRGPAVTEFRPNPAPDPLATNGTGSHQIAPKNSVTGQ